MRLRGPLGYVGQPLSLRPVCIAKLFKFSCNDFPQKWCIFGDPLIQWGPQRRNVFGVRFDAAKSWLKFRAPPCHIPIFKSLSVY